MNTTETEKGPAFGHSSFSWRTQNFHLPHLVEGLLATPNHPSLFVLDRSRVKLPGEKNLFEVLADIILKHKKPAILGSIVLITLGMGLMDDESIRKENTHPRMGDRTSKDLLSNSLQEEAISKNRLSIENALNLLKGESQSEIERGIWSNVVKNGYKFGLLFSASGSEILNKSTTVLRIPADSRSVLTENTYGTLPADTDIRYTNIIRVTDPEGKTSIFGLLDLNSQVEYHSGDKALSQWVRFGEPVQFAKTTDGAIIYPNGIVGPTREEAIFFNSFGPK